MVRSRIQPTSPSVIAHPQRRHGVGCPAALMNHRFSCRRPEQEGRMTEIKRSHIKRDTAQARAYSQAVITSGGRTIWLAGKVAAEDGAGRSLAGDFDGQVREIFARLG